MAASASPRQSSFFAPREPRMDAGEGPFGFGLAVSEDQTAAPQSKPARLVMPNSELTSAKAGNAKRSVPVRKKDKALMSSASRSLQPGLFDELDRTASRTVAEPEVSAVHEEIAITAAPSISETAPRAGGSYGMTITAFAAVVTVAGGLGFVTAPEPELITGSIAVVDQVLQAPVVQPAAFLLPQAQTVSLPVSAALGVGEGFLLKVLVVLLSLFIAVGGGFWCLRRLLSPKASSLHFDGRDQRIDASLVPPNISAR
ncbi:hypothetical protein [Ahrensia sp. R2A130]|uniref:hypothetical protein n=1 Tax=Ahrensia sp. R2A130 TaxID=744979 RepID=UPI0001E0B486|nr:hypothetical protein [Ahrensia sp. R2A130]EFL90724.1 hypothetical protein R2A130_0807 [Ahrensia sp. R2A130]